jgi:oxamate amidohydrolase
VDRPGYHARADAHDDGGSDNATKLAELAGFPPLAELPELSRCLIDVQRLAGRHMTGALTTPHPLATAAGMDVLHAGGNASEALIAAGAALTVVMPHFCGLGGDAVWLVADRHGLSRVFLAIGQAIDRPIPKGPFPVRGPGSVLTTAAVVDGWRHAFDFSRRQWAGRAKWDDLLAPAVRLAEEGFRVTRSQAFWGDFRKAECSSWPGFGAIFMDQGRPLPAGHLLVQPALATTLRSIAELGAAEFYHGQLAGRIVEGLRAVGVTIAAEDLARTATREMPPLLLPYRNLTLLAPPPPTQGVTTLQIMGVLSRFDLSGFRPGSTDHLHLCVEAVKRAFLGRGAIADPAFSRQTPEDWLNKNAIDELAGDISIDRAMPWPHQWQHGDTVFLGAIDEQGNAASVLQSTYFDWGSGVIAGDAGIIWQNRGAAFSSDPAHPNGFAPGKLPFYTLNPGIAIKNGHPHLVYGTQGADGQPQTLAMLLTHLIDFACPPRQALAAPRFLLGRTFSDSRDSLKIERDIREEVLADLAARGHEISAIPANSPLAGQAGIVVSAGGVSQAWHDLRQ